MTAEQLMNPRYEVIADYPGNQSPVGLILECPAYDNDFTKVYWVQANDKYPNLFRRMNWWEKRTEEQMPKKVVSKANSNESTFEIKGWDMEILVGWTDEKKRECCSLLSWNPEYGYFPID